VVLVDVTESPVNRPKKTKKILKATAEKPYFSKNRLLKTVQQCCLIF